MHINVEFNLKENIWSGWRDCPAHNLKMFNECVNVYGLKREEGKRKGWRRRMIYQNRVAQIPLLFPVLLPLDLLHSPLSFLAGGSIAGVNYLALVQNPQLVKLVTHQRCHGRNWSFWWIPVGNNLWCMDISFWYSFWNWRSVEAFQTVLTYSIRSASVIEVNSFRTRQQFWIWPPMQ